MIIKQDEELRLSKLRKILQLMRNKDDRDYCNGYNIEIEKIIWLDRDKKFDKIMEEKYGLFSLSNVLNVHVGFDLTHRGHLSEMNQKIQNSLNQLDIDETCWDDNCSRLNENQKERNWHRSSSIVYKRKEARIKDKNCSNSVLNGKIRFNCPGDLCEHWRWDGDKTLDSTPL